MCYGNAMKLIVWEGAGAELRAVGGGEGGQDWKEGPGAGGGPAENCPALGRAKAAERRRKEIRQISPSMW